LPFSQSLICHPEPRRAVREHSAPLNPNSRVNTRTQTTIRRRVPHPRFLRVGLAFLPIPTPSSRTRSHTLRTALRALLFSRVPHSSRFLRSVRIFAFSGSFAASRTLVYPEPRKAGLEVGLFSGATLSRLLQSSGFLPIPRMLAPPMSPAAGAIPAAPSPSAPRLSYEAPRWRIFPPPFFKKQKEAAVLRAPSSSEPRT
jgi:hypothetical protein